MITNNKTIPEYINLNSENKTQSIIHNGKKIEVRKNGHRTVGINKPTIPLDYPKDENDTYIVPPERRAKSVNGLLLSYTEAASIPLGELLYRYSDFEQDTGYDLQYPKDGLKAFMSEEIPNILYSTGLYITANRKLQPDEHALQQAHDYSIIINDYVDRVKQFTKNVTLQVNEFNSKSEQQIILPEFLPIQTLDTIFDSSDIKLANLILDQCLNNLSKIKLSNDTLTNLINEIKPMKKELKKLKTERLQERIFDDRIKLSFAKDIEKIKDNPIFKDCAVMLDSGGHQIYMNYLKKRNVGTYIYKYFMILNSLERINLAFSLDIHMDYPLITDPEEIWDLNCDSVEEMYRHDISKIIWVYQFRGAGLNSIWNALHDQYNIFDYMNKFAIGGVAKANKVGAINFPIFIPASTSIIAGINKVRNRTDNPVKFNYYQYHILGVATPTDYFQFGLIQRTAERFHNIPLHVTFDSSKIFRGQAAGAFMDYMTKNKIIRVDFKSNSLKDNVEGTTLSNELVLRTLISKLDEKYNYVSCLNEDIYIRSYTDEEIKRENEIFEKTKQKFIDNLSDEEIKREMDIHKYDSIDSALLSLIKKDNKMKALMDKIDDMHTKKCLNKKYWTRIVQLSYISMNSAIKEALYVADIMINIYIATTSEQIDFYHNHYFSDDENKIKPVDLNLNQFKNTDSATLDSLLKIKKEVISKIIREHLSKMNRNKNTNNLSSKSENTYEAIDLLYTLDEYKGFLINQRLLPEHEIFKHNSDLSFLPVNMLNDI